MTWSILEFGKHKGKTLPQILFTDPDWFFWSVEDGVFKDKGMLYNEAVDIFNKAKNIIIPQVKGNEKLIVEWVIHKATGKLSSMDFVHASKPIHVGSCHIYTPLIDLSIPRKIAQYDKFGYRIMLKALKLFLFNNASERMTKAKCEDFFDTEANFDLSQIYKNVVN